MKIRVVLASTLGLLAQVQVSAQVIDCVCDSVYSVGDRVELMEEVVIIPVGSLETVVCGLGAGLILIDWDGFDGGHDGNGYCGCGESEGTGTSNYYVLCSEITVLVSSACDSDTRSVIA